MGFHVRAIEQPLRLPLHQPRHPENGETHHVPRRVGGGDLLVAGDQPVTQFTDRDPLEAGPHALRIRQTRIPAEQVSGIAHPVLLHRLVERPAEVLSVAVEEIREQARDLRPAFERAIEIVVVDTVRRETGGGLLEGAAANRIAHAANQVSE